MIVYLAMHGSHIDACYGCNKAAERVGAYVLSQTVLLGTAWVVSRNYGQGLILQRVFTSQDDAENFVMQSASSWTREDLTGGEAVWRNDDQEILLQKRVLE